MENTWCQSLVFSFATPKAKMQKMDDSLPAAVTIQNVCQCSENHIYYILVWWHFLFLCMPHRTILYTAEFCVQSMYISISEKKNMTHLPKSPSLRLSSRIRTADMEVAGEGATIHCAYICKPINMKSDPAKVNTFSHHYKSHQSPARRQNVPAHITRCLCVRMYL